MGAMVGTRWFKFSLRTLFVVVTAIAVWLGYEFNWIRQRRAVVSECVYASRTPDPGDLAIDSPAGQLRPAPGMLWIFGEPGYWVVCLQFLGEDAELTPAEQAQIRRAARLFPEAQIAYARLATQ